MARRTNTDTTTQRRILNSLSQAAALPLTNPYRRNLICYLLQEAENAGIPRTDIEQETGLTRAAQHYYR